MKCRRAGKMIPLYTGGEVSEKKARRIEKHIKECPECRVKAAEFKSILSEIRAATRGDERDWQEAEWKRLMTRIKTQPPPRRTLPLGLIPNPAWAYGILTVLLLTLSIILLRPRLFTPTPVQQTEILASTDVQPGRSLEFPKGQFFHLPEDTLFPVQKEKQRPLGQEMMIASSAGREDTQETLSMTLVSQETGLKVHWTFNRNFEWKEEAKR